MGLGPEQSTRLRDIGFPFPSKDTDGIASQTGHDHWPIETSDLTPVFIKGDIQHIMLRILDTPMVPVVREDFLR